MALKKYQIYGAFIFMSGIMLRVFAVTYSFSDIISTIALKLTALGLYLSFIHMFTEVAFGVILEEIKGKIKVYKFKRSFRNLDKAIDKRLHATFTTRWIEENKNINVTNYFYYKYFTNSYRSYLEKELSSALTDRNCFKNRINRGL